MKAEGVRGRTKKVGSSLAIFVPATEARRAHLHPDRNVVMDLQEEEDEPSLGFLKRRGLSRKDFDRMDRELYPDE